MMTSKILNLIFHPIAASSCSDVSCASNQNQYNKIRNLIFVCFGWKFDFWTSFCFSERMAVRRSDKFFTTSWIISTIERNQINMNTNDNFNVKKKMMENGKRIMGTGKKAAEEWLVGLTSWQRQNGKKESQTNTHTHK